MPMKLQKRTQAPLNSLCLMSLFSARDTRARARSIIVAPETATSR